MGWSHHSGRSPNHRVSIVISKCAIVICSKRTRGLWRIFTHGFSYKSCRVCRMYLGFAGT